MPARVARLQDLERIDVAGVHLRPVRRALGLSAFGLAARAGRADDALEHLRRAVAREPQTAEWAAHDADLDPVRRDPRFAAALRRSEG